MDEELEINGEIPMSDEQVEAEFEKIDLKKRFKVLPPCEDFCHKCYKCGSRNMITEPMTRRLNPNHYELFDRFTCKDCKAMKTRVIAEVDKGMPEMPPPGQKSEMQKFLDKNKKSSEEIDPRQIKF